MADTDAAIKPCFDALLNQETVLDDENLRIEDFEPFARHILVRQVPPEKTLGTTKTLIVPDKFAQQKAMGFVVKVNPDDLPGPFEEGDLVLFAESCGYDVTVGEATFKVLQYHTEEEGEILGKWPAANFAVDAG